MLYHAYEFTHAAISPMRQAARMGQELMTSPFNPLAETYQARATAAACEMFINATRRYGKPTFGIEMVDVGNASSPVVEEVVLELPFCNLLHFEKPEVDADQPKVLIVAPMSGHYATLLRGTVKQMLPGHDVYITDWIDARDVPLTAGRFDLDDYADYVIEFCQHLASDGERPAVLAVCQPGVPVLAAASLMAERKDPARPSSITLMGSPIDVTQNPKQPNELATSRPLSWFENNVIVTVPWPNKGFLRRVYPGFLQLSGFMSMNLDRHVNAHVEHFRNMVKGDGDSAEQHRTFYDEYLAVMDLTAEFYLQTIERVFQKRLLAVGEYAYRGEIVKPSAITDIALMTIEGEKDDITGLGQTEAAHTLTTKLPKAKRMHYVQEKVGHYGVFNGSRWRQFIQPKVAEFIATHRADVA
ncbi:polyhydroxyalkanoate depolymerase [Pontivivens ytuae]|uniref:Polyhydroxyalkanoate depolymerase n=1 Tax=Pontivivens ytuae TaxID=2789856 RepID=A0A7S9QDS2_9RHOB|nr:polyhydroxyalkanoate depolymerase [Pontivivens ytuae]QPH55283.1 polyhydroxyalkanoate depolymerase [Pontivivens ytuae]